MNNEQAPTGNQHHDLAELAALSGIDRDWWDSLGNHHDVSEASLRHLLAGLRVLDDTGASDADIGAALHRERHALWHSLLPPVRVLQQDKAYGIELVVDEAALGASWHWQITLEDATQLEGSFTPSELAMAGHEGGGAGESRTDLDGVKRELRWLALPTLPVGYHRISVRNQGNEHPSNQHPGDEHTCTAHLIVAPPRCHEFAQESTGGDSPKKLWGFSVQLYALRSSSSSGIGDIGDLIHALEATHTLGADLVGINPLHALFAHAPEDASPYSPSSRVFINPLYIDLTAVPGYADLTQQERDASLPSPANTPEFVDYTAAAQCKLSSLELLFARLEQAGTDAPEQQAFARWQAEQGRSLQSFATFEMLRELDASDASLGHGSWRRWPATWQDPHSDAVAQLAKQHANRIRFHAWLQWLAATQLNHAAERAAELGLEVGLYRDLAVGIAANGADAWAESDVYVPDVHVGAPPDEFSVNGQDWGLPPMNPRELRLRGYAPFRDMLRANMSAAGALRIDHVMGLARLFFIPAGATPNEGAYVASDLEEMLAVLAIESTRARCVVIGEDLGTVPDGFRERLHAAGVLAYRLMYFEKHYESDGRFRQPQDYASQSLVGANTHDLPTLIGFWNGTDISLRAHLNLFPSEAMHERQLQERAADRHRLLVALAEQGLLPHGIDMHQPDQVDMNSALVDAIHRYLARSASSILVVNIEDVLGETEQMNLPGTDRDRYPNWRRRPALPVTEWSASPRFKQTAELISEER
jgi:(1->4)-alpha-D-glucan 1-alpha-D-glucosylmutase